VSEGGMDIEGNFPLFQLLPSLAAFILHELDNMSYMGEN